MKQLKLKNKIIKIKNCNNCDLCLTLCLATGEEDDFACLLDDQGHTFNNKEQLFQKCPLENYTIKQCGNRFPRQEEKGDNIKNCVTRGNK